MKTFVNLFLMIFLDYGKEDIRLHWERKESKRRVKMMRRKYGMW